MGCFHQTRSRPSPAEFSVEGGFNPTLSGSGQPPPGGGENPRRSGQAWRPLAPNSPEEPVPALGLVGEAGEGVHGAQAKAKSPRRGSRDSSETASDPRGRVSLGPQEERSLPAPWGRPTFQRAT